MIVVLCLHNSSMVITMELVDRVQLKLLNNKEMRVANKYIITWQYNRNSFTFSQIWSILRWIAILVLPYLAKYNHMIILFIWIYLISHNVFRKVYIPSNIFKFPPRTIYSFAYEIKPWKSLIIILIISVVIWWIWSQKVTYC